MVPPRQALNESSGSSRSTHEVRQRKKMRLFSRARRDGYYVSYGPTRRYICRKVPETVYTTSGDGRVATTKRQTCAACGRFRSAKWEAAHPLTPGQAAMTAICGRCQRDKTSSEDGPPKYYYKKRHHHHHHSRRCTDSTDDSYHTRDRRSPRRYRSDSRDYSSSRPSPRDNIRIVIANQPGAKVRPASTSSTSTSEEAVRVVRHTSIVEVPEGRRSRSKERSSSRAHYLDNGTAQYYETLVRPRRRPRSKSQNRVSYVEELSPSRSRHRRRSSNSRVAFVDDYDEPVIVRKSPRRISRRRAVYFDGAASFGPPNSEQEDRGRPRSRSSNRQSRNSNRSVQFIEEVEIPQPRGAEHNVKTGTVLSRPGSVSPTPHVTSNESRQITPTPTNAENTSRPQSARLIESGRSGSDSDHDRTPRPAFASLHRDHRPVYSRVPSGQKRSHSTTLGSNSSQQSSPGPHNVKGPVFDHVIHKTKAPQSKRRRKYRDDSTGDDYITANYRHVRAPSPPTPQIHPDYLSEMLQTAHITSPSQQSSWQPTRGPPSPPMTRSNSESESSSVYRPPYYRDVTSAGNEYGPTSYQYSPVEDLYGNKIGGHDYGYGTTGGIYGGIYGGSYGVEPLSAAEREYDWMT